MSQATLYRVRLAVLPIAGLRNPAAETVAAALEDLGEHGVEALSLGKLFVWQTRSATAESAAEEAQRLARLLLCNPVTETADVIDVMPVTDGAMPASLPEGADREVR